MYSKLANHTSVRKQAGDTIVEVLLALAVLGAVLGGAYVITSRNSIINQASQERAQAIKIAESQLEQLRNLFETNYEAFISPPSSFCVSGGSLLSGTSCTIDSSGAVTTSEPSYTIGVMQTPKNVGTTVGRNFVITVTWSNRTGSNDQLSYVYEIYR